MVERLLNKRIRRAGKGGIGQIIEYLVKWQGYSPEFDSWYNVKNLDNCIDLVQEYEAEMQGPQDPTLLSQTSKAEIQGLSDLQPDTLETS